MRTHIDQRHYRIMENISNRLEDVASKSNRSDLWNKLKNGFDKVRNSSVVALLGSLVAAGAVMAHGYDINHAGMVKDMTIPFASALGVGSASVAGALLSDMMSKFSKNKAFESSNLKNKELDRVGEELAYLSDDFQKTKNVNGVSQQKADDYNDLLSKYQEKTSTQPNALKENPPVVAEDNMIKRLLNSSKKEINEYASQKNYKDALEKFKENSPPVEKEKLPRKGLRP